MTEPTCLCHIQPVRERLQLSQAEVARRAGLSRQTVNMIERGRFVPSVTTAMMLADALECSVTDLFKKTKVEKPLEVTLSSTLHAQTGPVRLAAVGDRWIAIPVAVSEAAGFGEADGQLIARNGNTGKVRTLAPETQLRHNLLIAGSDPALGVVQDLWKRTNLEGNLRWQNLPSTAAFNALACGETHIAGMHFADPEEERHAVSSLKMETVVVRFAQCEQGWMLRRGNPLGFRSVEDLASNRVRFLNRVDGSSTRLLLDRLLDKAGVSSSRIPLYSSIAATHFDCATAIREGRADVAMGLRAVAESCNLDFLPVQQVAFDLIIPRALLDFPPAEKMLTMLHNRSLHRQLSSLAGYSTAETGKLLSGELVANATP